MKILSDTNALIYVEHYKAPKNEDEARMKNALKALSLSSSRDTLLLVIRYLEMNKPSGYSETVHLLQGEIRLIEEAMKNENPS